MRKTIDITISSDDPENRDKGKVFLLTEMDSDRGEKWAMRAVSALARAGTEIPDGLDKLGWAGIATFGFNALCRINFHEIEPLLDEMMGCVQVKPSPEVVRALHPSDIEEIDTRFILRKEVFTLHAGFFKRVQRLISA